MQKSLQFYMALLLTSIKASMSSRKAFLIESALMIANNFIFFSMWWLFFNEFESVDNWKMKEMTALLTIGIGSYSLLLILFGGTRSLGRIIMTGDLDSFMTQPKNILLHIASSKSAAKGWGHLMTAILLVFFGHLTDLKTIALLTVGVISGCLVFTSMRIIAHSISFWLGPIESLSERFADSLFVFALYPTNIYSGLLQLVMFTLIPAGVISYLPVEMIRDFSWSKLIILLASSSSFFAMAFFIFYKGLKRYESGNQFGVRA